MPTGRSASATTHRPTPRPSSSWSARATRRASRTGAISIKDGVEVITPNPKTSGGARWNYLAAWAYADQKFGHDEAKDKQFIKDALRERAGARYRRPRLDHDLRPARHRRRAARLGERGLPRARRAWRRQIRDRRAVALDQGRAAGRRGRQGGRRQGHAQSGGGLSEVPLHAEAQKLIAQNYYRPSDPKSADPKDLARFPDVKLVSIDDPLFGGWAKAQPKHFDDGGIFDQIYQPKSTN